MFKAKHISQPGFTLIEVLIAVTLSVILLAAASSLFFSALRSDSKKGSVSQLKDNGDYALSQMEFLLRNAISLEAESASESACASSMDKVVLRSADNGVTKLFLSNNAVASQSVDTGTIRYLTGGPTIASSLLFACSQPTENISTNIKISFRLQHSSESGSFYPESALEDFQTTVNVRSD